MADANQQSLDRFAPIPSPGGGDRAAELHNLTEKPLSPKDETFVSGSQPLDAAVSAVTLNAKEKTVASGTSGALSKIQPINSYVPQEPGYYVGGYRLSRTS